MRVRRKTAGKCFALLLLPCVAGSAGDSPRGPEEPENFIAVPLVPLVPLGETSYRILIPAPISDAPRRRGSGGRGAGPGGWLNRGRRRVAGREAGWRTSGWASR